MLTLALRCREWGLPDLGGLYEQDYATMIQIESCLNIYRAATRFFAQVDESKPAMTKSDKKIIELLVSEGLINV